MTATAEHRMEQKQKGERCASVSHTTIKSKQSSSLPKRPSSSKSHQSSLPMSSKIQELRAWLTTTNQFFESINLKKDQRRLSYADYQQFKSELETQEPFHSHLKAQNEAKAQADIHSSWKEIDTNWQKVETQVYIITYHTG
jgi:hypothetical protein